MPIWVSIIKPKEVIEPFLSMIEAFKSGDLRRSLIGTGRVNFLFTKDDVGKNKNWFHSKWREIDNKYIKPCLIDKEKLEEQRKVKEELEKRAGEDSQEIEIEDSGILESKKRENSSLEETKENVSEDVKTEEKIS